MRFRGIIIEESLVDNRILNNMVILKMYITSAELPFCPWLECTV